MTEVAETPALRQLDDEARAALFTSARTANTWADIPVTDDELRSIWELAKWAPTSANTQPLRVLYVRPGEGRDRLVKHMSDGNKAKTDAAPRFKSFLVINIGHPGENAWFPRLPRLAHEDVITWA